MLVARMQQHNTADDQGGLAVVGERLQAECPRSTTGRADRTSRDWTVDVVAHAQRVGHRPRLSSSSIALPSSRYSVAGYLVGKLELLMKSFITYGQLLGFNNGTRPPGSGLAGPISFRRAVPA